MHHAPWVSPIPPVSLPLLHLHRRSWGHLLVQEKRPVGHGQIQAHAHSLLGLPGLHHGLCPGGQVAHARVHALKHLPEGGMALAVQVHWGGGRGVERIGAGGCGPDSSSDGCALPRGSAADAAICMIPGRARAPQAGTHPDAGACPGLHAGWQERASGPAAPCRHSRVLTG